MSHLSELINTHAPGVSAKKIAENARSLGHSLTGPQAERFKRGTVGTLTKASTFEALAAGIGVPVSDVLAAVERDRMERPTQSGRNASPMQRHINELARKYKNPRVMVHLVGGGVIEGVLYTGARSGLFVVFAEDVGKSWRIAVEHVAAIGHDF